MGAMIWHPIFPISPRILIPSALTYFKILTEESTDHSGNSKQIAFNIRVMEIYKLSVSKKSAHCSTL
jgi:hypothetical protein